MSSDPTPARKTVRIGKYEIVAHIATGGMGAVYKAIDTDLNREVALKILSPEMASNPALLERFRREARSAAKLRHENIVAIYECGEAHGTYFLALEFVAGIDLHEFISRKGRLDPEEARQIALQATRALEHAHRAGIVHRDIKPSNFMIETKDGRMLVKLTDMGLARETRNDAEFRVTRDGSTVGTVDYMSPEQARDSGTADIRSDIYSLGCTIYHMLSGQPPFPEGSLTERLFKHLEANPPDIAKLNPAVSESFRAVLRRMLAKKPEERYQSPTVLIRDLERLEGRTTSDAEKAEKAERSQGEAERPPKRAQKRASSREVERPSAAMPRPKAAPPPSEREPDESEEEAAPRPSRRRDEEIDTRETSAPRTKPVAAKRSSPGEPRKGLNYWLIGAGAIGLVAVLIVALLSSQGGHAPPRKPDDSGVANVPSNFPDNPFAPAPMPDEPKPPPEPRPAPENTEPVKPSVPMPPAPMPAVPTPPAPMPRPEPPIPAGPRLPALYKPLAAIAAEALQRQAEAPWESDAALPAGTPVLRVSRQAPSGGGFDSVGAACAAAPLGQTAVIEIHDNGPLFLTPEAVSRRSLVLRAGKGYRPLLAWDVGAARPETGSRNAILLALTEGSLTLEDLDVVVRWPEGVPEAGCLFRVVDGDFLARGCTFSIASKHPAGLTLVRLDPGRTNRPRCRLSRCLARGAGMVALDAASGGADVLVDHSLIVGGAMAPLIRVAGRNAPGGAGDTTLTALRFVRSTLVAGEALVQVRSASPTEMAPALSWFSWDALIARSSGEQSRGGELIAFLDKANSTGMTYQAVNTLFAGWRHLLRAANGTIAASDLTAWRERWKHAEGEVIEARSWPAGVIHEPEDVAADHYKSEGPMVGFAATGGPGALGCEVANLPSPREAWRSLTYQRFEAPDPEPIAATGPPEIPTTPEDGYHGELIDFGQKEKTFDLGSYLTNLLKDRKAAPKIVLHLVGSGEKRTSPLFLKGSSLVLHFEQPPEPADKNLPGPDPLSLLVATPVSLKQKALVEVEGGGLDVINGVIRCEPFRIAVVPPYLLKTSGGDLRLHGCRIEGRTRQSTDSDRFLLCVEAASKGSSEQGHACVISDSLLLNGKGGLHVIGTGVRMLLRRSLLVCGTDACYLEPGSGPTGAARMALSCSLQNVTIGAGRAMLHLGDAANVTLPAEPAIVRTRGCVFLNPFADASGASTAKAGMLLCEGKALARGLLVWQSTGDLYDKRLHYRIAPFEGPMPDKQQAAAVWTRTWGSFNDGQPVVDAVLPPGQFDFGMATLPLGRLVLPSSPRWAGKSLGADVIQLAQLGAKRPARIPPK